MKKNILHFIKITLVLVLFLQVGKVSAQNFVVWNYPTTAGTTPITGTYPGGTVSVANSGTGSDIKFYPNSFVNYINLNGATAGQGFFTSGPSKTPPSKSLTFTFSSPVSINELSISDIDLSATNWYDGFSFSGITFTSVTGDNCTYTLTGATPTGNLGATEWARWSNATGLITSFTINYLTSGGLTNADLHYAIKVTACNAGTTAPTLSATTLTADCPANSMNLNGLVTSTLPTGASLKWYTDAAHTTEVPNPTTISVSGTFYAFYVDTVNNCYSPASAAVTTTACPLNKTNACPAASIDLASTVTSTAPTGYTYTYHSATPPTDANKLTSTVVTTPGTYYLAAYFAAQNCYTATSRPMVVTIVDCCAILAPPTFN